MALAHAVPRPTRHTNPFLTVITIRNGEPRCPLCGDPLNRDAWTACGDLAGCAKCATISNSEWLRCVILADNPEHARHLYDAHGIRFFRPRDVPGTARTLPEIAEN